MRQCWHNLQEDAGFTPVWCGWQWELLYFRTDLKVPGLHLSGLFSYGWYDTWVFFFLSVKLQVFCFNQCQGLYVCSSNEWGTPGVNPWTHFIFTVYATFRLLGPSVWCWWYANLLLILLASEIKLYSKHCLAKICDWISREFLQINHIKKNRPLQRSSNNLAHWLQIKQVFPKNLGVTFDDQL